MDDVYVRIVQNLIFLNRLRRRSTPGGQPAIMPRLSAVQLNMTPALIVLHQTSYEDVLMNLQPLAPYLSIAEIILAVAITVLVLLQSKGADLGGFMGGSSDTTGYRTKRGVEKTLHQVTIYFSIAFFILTFLTFVAWGQAG